MKTANRLEKIPPYLFMTLRTKINEAKARGVDVISLAIGDPVDPTPQPVIDAAKFKAGRTEFISNGDRLLYGQHSFALHHRQDPPRDARVARNYYLDHCRY